MKNLIVTPVLALLMCCSAFAQNESCDKFQALVSYNNVNIALLTRLNTDYRTAITWESIDADHPDAVKVREKIDREEEQIKANPFPEKPTHEDIVLASKTCRNITDDFISLSHEYNDLVDELVKLRQQFRALRGEEVSTLPTLLRGQRWRLYDT